MADVKVTLKRVIDGLGNTDNIHPTTDWDQVENKPTTFTPTAHTLNSHTDVNAVPTAAGQVLTWDADNSVWVASTTAGGGVSKADLQNVYIYGKADVAITKGQAIQFAGAQGDHILMKPAVPSEINSNPDYMIGIAETDLSIGDFGYVLVNGRLILDTSTYTAGDILYFASAGSTAGALTTTEPTGGTAIIQMAAVSISGVGNGEFVVRTLLLSREIHEVIDLQDSLDAKVNKSGDTMSGALNIGGATVADASLHIKQSYGGFDRLTQINPSGASKPALNLMASTDGSSNNQWWSWGVDTGNLFKIQPGTSFSGSTGLFVDSSGNVGIGNTSPGAKLDVNTGNSSGGIKITANNTYNSQLFFYNESTLRSAITSIAGGNLAFYHNGGDKLVIDNNGNVGIGTTSPSKKLEIAGTSYVNQTGGGDSFLANNTASYTVLKSDLSGARSWQIDNVNGAVQWYMDGTADQYLFNMTTDGKVGIGTTSPAEKLQVQGNAVINGDLTLNGDFNITGTYTQIDTNVNTTEQWLVTNDGTGPAAIINQTGAQPVIDIQDDGVSAFYIADGGLVGIGTTSPTEKLHIVDGRGYFSQDSSDRSLMVESRNNTVTTIVMRNSTATANENRIGSDGLDLFFKANSSEVMRLKSDGKVGIGTASPVSLLEVKAPNGSTGTITVGGGNTTVTAVGEVNAALDFRSNDASVNNTNNIAGRIASITEITNGAYAGLGFYTYKQGRTPDLEEAMRIDYQGNVLIGKDTNDESSVKLNVWGKGIFRNKLQIQNEIPVLTLKDTDSTGDAQTGYINFWDNNNAEKAWIGFGTSATTDFTIRNAYDGDINLLGGNVGIGTSTPGTKLDVIGTTRISNGQLSVYNGTGSSVYGRIDAADQYHSIVLRGDINGTTSQTVTAGDQITFGEYGGIFNFKTLSTTENALNTQIRPAGLEIYRNGYLKQNAYYKKTISLPSPPSNSGAGRWFVRLWQTSAGATFSGGKIRVGGTWSWANIMGHIEIDYGVYVAASSTSINSGSTRFSSGVGGAYDNLRIGDIEVVDGYAGFYVWSSNTNGPYVHFDIYCTREPLFESTAWASNALPAQRAVEFEKGIDVTGNISSTTIGTTGNISGTSGRLVMRDNSLENHFTNADSDVSVNYVGYAGGTTQFRDFNVYDGKASLIASFDGSAKQLNMASTATNPKIDFTGHAGAASYNYLLRGWNDTGAKAIHFVNGSTRSADGGANVYTIRNDGGHLRLGQSAYETRFDGTITLLRSGTEYSNYIRAQNYPSAGYTNASDKYWIEYGSKGGHHFVLDTDGGVSGGNNNFDNFTIWKGIYDNTALFQVSNGGQANLTGTTHNDYRGLMRITNNSSGSTGASSTYRPALEVLNYNGNHSWGVALQIAGGEGTNGDLPSIKFSPRLGSATETGQTTWSIGYADGRSGGYKFNISENHGLIGTSGSWGTKRFTIAPGGNVGIGTTSPPGKLSIAQSSYDGGQNRNQAIYIGMDGGDSDSEYFTMGYKATSRSGESHHTGYTNAFYIEAGAAEAGGIMLEQDGVVVYGSGDDGYTFQVFDKDTDTYDFGVQQSTGNVYARGNVYANINQKVVTETAYASSSTGGTVKMRVDGTTLYIRNDGTNA